MLKHIHTYVYTIFVKTDTHIYYIIYNILEDMLLRVSQYIVNSLSKPRFEKSVCYQNSKTLETCGKDEVIFMSFNMLNHVRFEKNLLYLEINKNILTCV